jgi:hypothetical protein
MHSDQDFQFAKRMIAWGLNDCQVSRLVGIPRTTIKDWRTKRVRNAIGASKSSKFMCPICHAKRVDEQQYAYLLGLYLGDGCISAGPRGVYKLRITLDDHYPGIINECRRAMATVVVGHERTVGRVRRPGCSEIVSCWKHWPCLFPQHGAGPKFLRPIRLVKWQQQIAAENTELVLRGLIHSDGCRVMNTVHCRYKSGLKIYSYPRYLFTNNSEDIRTIFCEACERFGVSWRQMNWKTIAISKKADVARLDEIIGPKR